MGIKIKVSIQKKDFIDDGRSGEEKKQVLIKFNDSERKSLEKYAVKYKFHTPGRFATKLFLNWLSTQE